MPPRPQNAHFGSGSYGKVITFFHPAMKADLTEDRPLEGMKNGSNFYEATFAEAETDAYRDTKFSGKAVTEWGCEIDAAFSFRQDLLVAFNMRPLCDKP